MMKNTFLFALMLFGSTLIFSQTTITGTVNDLSLGTPLPSININVSKKSVGTITNFDGKFSLKVKDAPPFTIEISSIGYTTEKVEITKNNQKITVSLKENATSLDEIVISASRTPERVMESPVTIERFDSRSIKNTPSLSFYDGLENLKGVDINTNSLTYKSVNTRGFATFSNGRFVQLTDGMDNASPGLNFAIGNLLGLSELDVESVEILPGAASALYGANAFNGIMIMTSKSPFDYPGISFEIKGGATSQDAAGTNQYYDATIRMAHAFSDYFAAKATYSYLEGEEWHATDSRNTSGVSGVYIPGTRETENDYDGANVYGDEVVVNLGEEIGRVSRDGYNEVDLLNNEAKTIKLGASLNYRPWGNDRFEVIWNSKYGTGNTIFQGQNRYSLTNFSIHQHKLEFKGTNFFVRGYYTSEDSGDSYDTRFTAININRQWKSDADWFGQYAAAFLGAIPNVEASNHQAARAVANTGRFEPGTAEFNTAFNNVTSDTDLITGSRFGSKTSLYHADANLNLRDHIDWAEVQVGASFRQYRLNSSGTIYTDTDGVIPYDEYGFYTQLQKKILEDRLKLTASARFDKSQNFDGNVSPRLSLAYALGKNKNHNFRTSFQTGFRNPSTQDQYIGLATGASFIIGTAPDNLDRYSVDIPASDGTTVTLTGRDALTNSFSEASVINGTFEQSNIDLIKPEQVVSFEIGYRGAIPTGKNKLSIDFSTYYNDYTDFIALKNAIVPLYGSAASPNLEDGSNSSAITAITNGDFTRFTVSTNSEADISSYGIGLGLNTKIFNGFITGLNYTWSKFEFDQESDPDFSAGFNTPEHKVKFQFGKPNVYKNFGFNVNVRWQDKFLWEDTFLEGSINARTTVDAQVNYKIPSLKSIFKLGATNLGGQEYFSAPGSGAIGSQVYLSWTVNNN